MSVKHLKLVGAAGAAALTVGLVAAPALAAGEETASVDYTCVVLGGGTTPNATPTASFAVNAPPTTVAAGQLVKLPTTSVFTLDPGTTGLATGFLNWVQFSGKITTAPSNSGVGLSISFPKTTLANNPDGSTTANATGSTLLKATKVGTYALQLGNLGNVHLTGFDGSGATLGTVNFPDTGLGNGTCTNNATTTPLEDSSATPSTVTVVKDASATSVKAAYNAKTKVASGTATVKGKHGLAGTGKVSFTLKKGTHTVKTVAGTLKKGVAKASFTGVRKAGTYSITAKFGGDAALKASSGKASFTVK
jgi:large repetitive protein